MLNKFMPNSQNSAAFDAQRPLVSTKPAETKSETTEIAAKPATREEGSKLIVGPNIKLKGSEITDCEILVVEGRVEASMNSRDIRIAEGGVFSGKAEIDVAEVRGHFDGDLIARKRLVIYATGKVTGVIRYGAILIEEGGVISGDVAAITIEASLAKVPELSAQVKPAPGHEEIPRLEHTYPASSLARSPVGRRQG